MAVVELVDLLRRRADERPEGLAYASLDDGGRDGRRLTYAELDASARRIAAWLQVSRAPGDRALLLFPAGLDVLEAFFGCLYAGINAIPAPPPEASRLKRTLPRLRAIAADAGVSLVISQPGLAPLIAGTRDVPGLEGVECLDIRSIPADFDEPWRAPEIAADDLAYLQYTSGSTTSPKGVMISHRNVVHHCGYLRRCCEYTPESISLTWLPYFHDYGLIEGLLEPLYNGTPGHIMSPFAFLKRPSQWLQAISRLRATHTQAPNFAYELCVRRARPDQLEGMDLSHLRSAGNGAEPINPRVLEAFYRTFAPYGFRREAFCPAYPGLAEATLMASCCSPSMEPKVGRFRADAMAARRVIPADPDDATAREVASCRRIVGEFEVAIVDPETATRCGDDQVGEVWLGDPSVARGYWRRDRRQGDLRRHAGRHGRGALPAHRRPGLPPRWRALPDQPDQGPDHRRRGEPPPAGHRVERRALRPGHPPGRGGGVRGVLRRRGAAGDRRRGRAGRDPLARRRDQAARRDPAGHRRGARGPRARGRPAEPGEPSEDGQRQDPAAQVQPAARRQPARMSWRAGSRAWSALLWSWSFVT